MPQPTKTLITRVTRSRQDAKATYDTLSKWYDLLAEPSEQRFRRLGLDLLQAQRGEAVVDVGCGTGRAVVALARSAGTTGTVCGIDISTGMLNVTRKRVVNAKLTGRIELLCGDAVNLPLDGDCMDAVFMSFTLELFDTPEIPRVLEECRRVLRRGGRICIVALSKRENVDVPVRLYEWAHVRFPRYLDCRPILPRKAAADAGFAIANVVEETMWGLPITVVLARNRNTEISHVSRNH